MSERFQWRGTITGQAKERLDAIRDFDENLEPVTVGVIGLGYWGPNLLRALVEMETAQVTRICDLDPARLRRYARRYPSAAPTTDVEGLFTDEELDAVIIATPVFTHFDLACRSLGAGKHTFVEKPLASSVTDAEHLIALAGVRERTLMAGLTFLYSPPVHAVKRLLDDGVLGELYFVSSSRVNLGLHQRDISVIWDLGPHDFSILLYWMNEMPSWVRAVGRDAIGSGVPDVAFITLGFPSGVLANLELSWLSPTKLRRTVLVGSQQMVVYEDGVAEQIKQFDHGVVYEDPETFGQYQLSYRTGDVLAPKLDTTEPISAELADFVDAVRSDRTMPEQLELARQVIVIVQAAEASLNEGGAKVALDGTPALSSRRAGRVP